MLTTNERVETATKRILIAEDESITALDIRRTLERLGYDVVAVASSGEDAVQRAIESCPDLLLMDIRFKGGIDGIEAVARIHETIDVPAVFITAYGDEETLDRARLTAPFGYVLKPVGERDLRVAIETALERHRIEQELKQRVREVEALNQLFRAHLADWSTLVDGRSDVLASIRSVVEDLGCVIARLESWPVPESADTGWFATDDPSVLCDE